MSEAMQIDVEGLRVTGRSASPSPSGTIDHPPLIVALHGGGFTSGYFDCDRFSLLDRASAAGCFALALDRPGYGSSSALPAGDRKVQRNAELLGKAIGRVWQERDHDAAGVVLVGHSIGAGVVNCLAAQLPDWPLLGIAFSGALISPPEDIPPFWEDYGRETWIHTPREVRDGFFFGPPDTYPPYAPRSCDSVSQATWWGEVIEMFTWWPEEAERICARIGVPVHCRLGELDITWAREQDDLDRMAAAYAHAPSVDVALVPRAGHCVDFHHSGKDLHEDQIAFAIRCAAGRNSRCLDSQAGRA